MNQYYSIDKIPLIITFTDSIIHEFIELGVTAFFNELNGYINHNQDPEILKYANEQTLVAMFANGLIRNDGNLYSLTSVQEYSSDPDKDDKNGRTDIFFRYGDNAIWCESKYFKIVSKIDHNKHWKIKEWLEWDEKKVFNQLMKYYIAESNNNKINKSYSRHYAFTLVFKLIFEDKKEMFQKANENLKPYTSLDYLRDWFYCVGFIESNEANNKSYGVEVYGTITKNLKTDK